MATPYAQRGQASGIGLAPSIGDSLFPYEFSEATRGIISLLRTGAPSKDLILKTIDEFDIKIDSLRHAVEMMERDHANRQEAQWLYNAASAAADFLKECESIGLPIPKEKIPEYCSSAMLGFRESYAIVACLQGMHEGAQAAIQQINEAYAFMKRHGEAEDMQEFYYLADVAMRLSIERVGANRDEPHRAALLRREPEPSTMA